MPQPHCRVLLVLFTFTKGAGSQVQSWPAGAGWPDILHPWLQTHNFQPRQRPSTLCSVPTSFSSATPSVLVQCILVRPCGAHQPRVHHVGLVGVSCTLWAAGGNANRHVLGCDNEPVQDLSRPPAPEPGRRRMITPGPAIRPSGPRCSSRPAPRLRPSSSSAPVSPSRATSTTVPTSASCTCWSFAPFPAPCRA